MKSITFKIVVFLILLCVHIVSRSDETSLCGTDEIMIASCRLNEKKGRIVSFCSHTNKREVNYRFGLSSKVELSAGFSNSALLSRWVDAATYTVYFGFRRGRYSYIFGVPQETQGAKAFLEVAKDDKNLINHECIGNSFGDKVLSNDAIHDVADDLVRDNNFIFPPYDKKNKSLATVGCVDLPASCYAVEIDYHRNATVNSFRIEKRVYRYIRQYENPCLYIEILNPEDNWQVVYAKKICSYDGKGFYNGYASVDFSNFIIQEDAIKFDMRLITLPPVGEKNLKCLIRLDIGKIEDPKCTH